MRYLAIFLALFLVYSVQAQGYVINPYAVDATGEAYLLDAVPGAAAAYSLMRLSSTYTGPAVRAFRLSDSDLADICFDGDQITLSSLIDDDLDGACDDGTLSTWIGSGSAEGRIIYDQSGSGLDATQTTNTRRPILVNSGALVAGPNSTACMDFDGSDTDYFETADVAVATQPNIVFIVAKQEAYVAANRGLFDGVSARQLIRLGSAGREITAGTVLQSSTTGTDWFLIDGLFDGASSEIAINGTTAITGNAGAANLTGIRLGQSFADAPGLICEWVIYDSALGTGTELDDVRSNINTRYGLW